MAGACKHGNESLDFIKHGEHLDQLSYYQCLKNSTPVS